MAITASIALSSATAKAEQRVTASLTVNNSGGAAVTVTSVQPTLVPSGLTSQSVSAGVGVPMFGGAFASSVAASGALVIPFDVVAHAPTTSYGLAEPASLAYSVGATVGTSDGAVTVATPATLTVTNPAGL